LNWAKNPPRNQNRELINLKGGMQRKVPSLNWAKNPPRNQNRELINLKGGMQSNLNGL